MSELKLVCGKCGSPFPSHTDECDANIPIVSGSTQSHLRLLAGEVLKAHLIEEWDTMEDQIVERPCQCHVCKVAREVMG